jgi:hypothetical protein
MIRFVTVVGVIFFSATIATAEESDRRQETECFPIKELVSMLSKFDKLKDSQRDTVGPEIVAKFTINDGGDLPARFYHKHGEEQGMFNVADDGEVTDFSKVKDLPEEAEICVHDPARAGESKDASENKFDVDFGVLFQNRSGSHSLDEIGDGLKDGRAHYKRIVPAPFRMMVPKMTHVTIEYQNPEEKPDIQAFKGETLLSGLVVTPFKIAHVIDVEHLESLGADRLVIAGGPYALEPTPSIEKMQKMNDGEDETEGAEAEGAE